jgi:hypothetical protein
LDGSGSPTNLGPNYTSESSAGGLAIDPAGGKIYWDTEAGAIRVGNLDGSGSPSNLGASYANEAGPSGLAVDPTAGKIYWANTASGAIRVGNLDGSGSPANLGFNYIYELAPEGLAIDPAAGKIYWTGGGAIRVGNLNGRGSPANLGPNYGNERAADALAIIATATAKLTNAKISAKHHSAKFTFRAIGKARGFQCALVKKPADRHRKLKPRYRSCRSPTTYRHLRRGRYTFLVRALNGRIPGKPVSKNFKV